LWEEKIWAESAIARVRGFVVVAVVFVMDTEERGAAWKELLRFPLTQQRDAERTYKTVAFRAPVKHLGFDDHNPPTLELLDEICKDVAEWYVGGGWCWPVRAVALCAVMQ
jgi:hypothetical protein